MIVEHRDEQWDDFNAEVYAGECLDADVFVGDCYDSRVLVGGYYKVTRKIFCLVVVIKTMEKVFG